MDMSSEIRGSGRTMANLHILAENVPKGSIIVYTEVPYAKAVEYGSPPHIIVPKVKKALAFEIGGEKVVVKKVKHPGNPPQPFMRPAVWQTREKALRYLKQTITGKMSKWGCLNAIGLALSSKAKELSPWKTGNLRRFIFYAVKEGPP